MAHITKERLQERFFDAGLEPSWPQLAPLIRPAITSRFYRCSDSTLLVGSSKRGGSPDLPLRFEWPLRKGKPCEFLCQINLADTAPFDVEGLLPKAGLLSFFYAEDFGVGRVDGDPVFYFPPHVPLERREEGDDEAQELSFSLTWVLPNIYSSAKLDFLRDHLPSQAAFHTLLEALEEEEILYTRGGSHLLGHSDDYQGDHEPECELVYLGERTGFHDPGGEALVKRLQEVRQQAYSHWLCLLEDTEFSGGVFTLNYCIRRDDLARQDFSKTIGFAVN